MRTSRVTVTLALLLAAAPLRANSMVTHVRVAEQSIDRVTAQRPAAIVRDPTLRAVIQSGAIYPDSGYSVRHPYGEWAHWESLHEPYLQRIRSRWGAAGYTSTDACRHVAFLMGNAAHGMTDQTFDQYFIHRVRAYDRTNADDLDVGADTWLIVEHGVQSAADGRFWFDEMPMLHAAVNGPCGTAPANHGGSLWSLRLVSERMINPGIRACARKEPCPRRSGGARGSAAQRGHVARWLQPTQRRVRRGRRSRRRREASSLPAASRDLHIADRVVG